MGVISCMKNLNPVARNKRFMGALTLAVVFYVLSPFAAEFGVGGVSVQAAERERPQKTRRVPAITEYTFKKLGEIQEFIELKDYQGALEVANQQLSRRRLNGNEIGQYNSMLGFIYFSLEDYDKAITAYKEVIAQGDDVPEGLEVTSLYTLAQLSFVAEHYDDALTFMELWITKATNPGPAPHYFMGQVYYQMKNYPSAIEQIELCIQVAQERGTVVKETWWVLLNFLYFEEENWDKVIEVLEILVQDFPKRDYWVRLAGIHGQLGNDQMQVQVMEAAYNSGFLDSEDYEKLVQSLRELSPKTNPPDYLQTEQAFSVDGDYLPIVTVAPLYPASARTAGIEGYVILEFEVTSTGAVANPIVIESSPAEVFDQAAVTAALKFKYKPRVVDGKPVSVAGIRNRINFELTD